MGAIEGRRRLTPPMGDAGPAGEEKDPDDPPATLSRVLEQPPMNPEEEPEIEVELAEGKDGNEGVLFQEDWFGEDSSCSPRSLSA